MVSLGSPRGFRVAFRYFGGFGGQRADNLSLQKTSSAAKAKASKALAAIPAPKLHRILIQVDQYDPAVINLALNNATNIIEYYRSKGKEVAVDVVTYGPGLHMLRADTSPVQDRIKQLKNIAFPSSLHRHWLRPVRRPRPVRPMRSRPHR